MYGARLPKKGERCFLSKKNRFVLLLSPNIVIHCIEDETDPAKDYSFMVRYYFDGNDESRIICNKSTSRKEIIENSKLDYYSIWVAGNVCAGSFSSLFLLGEREGTFLYSICGPYTEKKMCPLLFLMPSIHTYRTASYRDFLSPYL